MGMSQQHGVNYVIEGDSIEIFGTKGAKLERGTWALDFGGFLAEVDPDSMVEAIRRCIESDVKSGNSDKVSIILMAPRSAVVFYLEGRLTREQLEASTEGADFIDVPGVEFDGRNLTLRVLKDSQYNVASADSEGNVL
jgi:hypothetical protein